MGLRDNESKRAVPELARCEARLAAVLRAQGGGDGKVEDDGDAVMGTLRTDWSRAQMLMLAVQVTNRSRLPSL